MHRSPMGTRPWRDPGGSEAYEGPALPRAAGRPRVGLASLYIASTDGGGGVVSSFLAAVSAGSRQLAPRRRFGPRQRRPRRRPRSVRRWRLRPGAGEGVGGVGAPPGGARAPAPPANGRRQRPGHAAPAGARGRCGGGNCPATGLAGRGRPPPCFPVYCTSNSWPWERRGSALNGGSSQPASVLSAVCFAGLGGREPPDQASAKFGIFPPATRVYFESPFVAKPLDAGGRPWF